MAAAAAPQTPQRQMPGFYFNTPALNRQPSFEARAFNRPQHGSTAEQAPVSYPNLSNSLNQPMPAPPPKSMSLVERAAKTINDKLDQDKKFPTLDSYLTLQPSTAEYEVPASAAWAPFQRMKIHEIPDQVLEQYNNAQFSTSLGLFAEIGHAWVAIDNSLYLWDFTHPNPEVIGYEEAQSGITSVQLVRPRQGVFVASITHLIVVATTTDIQLVGVACESGASGANVSLYRTDMRTPTNRMIIDCIASSPKTGRIFFSGKSDNEIYELTYQQEDSWFKPKCAKVCHTRSGAKSYIPSNPFGNNKSAEHIIQLTLDDSRNTLYALSSNSTLRAFTLRGTSELMPSVEKRFSNIFNEAISRTTEAEILSRDSRIVSLNTIATQESFKVVLLATTSTGCRLYFTGVLAYGGITSLTVHHVRFPPPESLSPPDSRNVPTQAITPYAHQQAAFSSKALTRSTQSYRFSPGYFVCFVEKGNRGEARIFMSSPDAGRFAQHQDQSLYNKFPEFGQWVATDMPLEVGLSTAPFSASPSPDGFGNELAVQFDQPVTELAVLTNSSVSTYRRRRLVDVFASVIRYGGSGDGLTGEIRNFAYRYGRGETIATALAVACGQASDVSGDSRVTKVTDNQILQTARETFINHGGRPEPDQSIIPDSGVPAIDLIRPSPRHDGLALYLSRLLRSVWRAKVIAESQDSAGALKVSPTLPLGKLQGIQRDLVRLQEFLNDNKSSIQGLAGPDALGRVATKQDEVALQAEHRALSSLLRLVSDVIEGIAFVLVLFDENMVDIILALTNEARQQARDITYERLFCTAGGKDLAKELVKAIVNRNIAQGMNIDTVTGALQRRCGSFCSADDSVIFKAQEQLKKASDSTMSNEMSRGLLNSSLQNLMKVAGSLTGEQLKWATHQYIHLQFFAGAVRLVLSVANEHDRGNSALAWLKEGQPGQDGSRESRYKFREECYSLVHDIINAVDASAASAPETVDGLYTPEAKRHREAYEEINGSADELFHINLYDWYLSNGWANRILDSRSPFVVSYLQRQSESALERADLLSKYFAHHHDFIEAAHVQLELAKSEKFTLTLETRITYLSYARANASTKTVGLSSSSTNSFTNGNTYPLNPRQSRHQLLRDINDLLQIASIQSDLLDRIKSDTRISPTRQSEVIDLLNGPILSIDMLFNQYADPGGYHDIALSIYQAADHRNPADIRATWTSLIESLHEEALANESAGSSPTPQPHGATTSPPRNTTIASRLPSGRPWEVVGEAVRTIGARLGSNEAVFPLSVIIPLLYRYLLETNQHAAPSSSRGNDDPNVAAPHFIPSLFITPPLSSIINPESAVAALETLFYTRDVPFKSRSARRLIASDLVWLLTQWFERTRHGGLDGLFSGGEETAEGVLQLLNEVGSSDVGKEEDVSRGVGELMRSLHGLLR